MSEDRIDAELARAAATVAPTAARLFVALTPPAPVVAQLTAVAEQLARRAQTAGVPIRWLPPADYHLTLSFLGWRPIESIEAVREAVERAVAGVAPLSLTLGGLGAFPSPDRARVVWAGLDKGGEAVAALAARLDQELAEIGIASPGRPLVPHVTLGRLSQDRSISDLLVSTSAHVFSECVIPAVDLVDSSVKTSTSNDRNLRSFALGSPKNGPRRQSPALEPAAPTHQRPPASTSIPDTDDGWPRGEGPAG
ncbi:MAG: RNA 2',3'-cyclic phosphodiesterase [Kofleriaceae bacterium]